MSEDTPKTAEIAHLTSAIVSAYLENNTISPGDLPGLISTVAQALQGTTGAAPAPTEELKPAVPIRRSVQPDAITCLECGKGFKSIKRHLEGQHGLTPQQYRARWGLARDYPTTAPNYAAQRSELAKAAGLGQGGRKPAKAAKTPAAKAPVKGKGRAAK